MVSRAFSGTNASPCSNKVSSVAPTVSKDVSTCEQVKFRSPKVKAVLSSRRSEVR